MWIHSRRLESANFRFQAIFLILTLAISTLLVGPMVDTVKAATCSSPYTVQAGDYWYRIARNCDVPFAELIAANPVLWNRPGRVLYRGDQIVIPGAEPECTDDDFHLDVLSMLLEREPGVPFPSIGRLGIEVGAIDDRGDGQVFAYGQTVGTIVDEDLNHFVALFTLDEEECSWTELDRHEFVAEFDPDFGYPFLDSIQVMSAENESYLLAPLSFMPGAGFQLLGFDGAELILEAEGSGGRTAVSRLYQIGEDRFGAIHFTPPPGGPIQLGVFEYFTLFGQTVAEGPLDELVTVEYNGFLSDLGEVSAPFAEFFVPSQVRFDPEDGYRLQLLIGESEPLVVRWELSEAGTYELVSGAARRYHIVEDDGFYQLIPSDGLVLCGQISDNAEDLVRGDWVDLRQVNDEGASFPVDDANRFWLHLSASGSEPTTGWAIWLTEVFETCPGLFDPHTGLPIGSGPPVEGETVLLISPELTRSTVAGGELELDLRLPRFVTLSSPAAVATFNAQMETLRASEVAEMEALLEEFDPVAGQPSSLQIWYELVGVSDDYLSILIKRNHFVAGTAHPVGVTHRGVNLRMNSGLPILLENLFLPGADYLTALADYASAEISTIGFGSVTIPPTEDALRHWTFGIDGVQLAFDTGEVGPSAAGPIRVTVDYRALLEILDPMGPAADFTNAIPSLGG